MIFGLDFNWLTDQLYFSWLLNGLWVTMLLALIGTASMLVVGVAGAAIVHFRVTFVHPLVIVLVDLFRNTPPLVQLFFLYFMLSDLGVTITDHTTGAQIPMFSGFACVVISLALYNGSIAVEIVRSGIGAVPSQTVEAARALGYSRGAIFRLVELPLAMRTTIPNMTSNVVSLIKTSAQASLVAVADVMFYATQISLETFLNLEVMIVIWIIYLVIASITTFAAKLIGERLSVPGFSGGVGV
ncbi:amino acid ABC transporter permease [Rhizobium sp. ARZ01]|uniref:amino acid ABC transporter permease n=1 Tax=Rhizobium sp. ARZ01 TaxID=2769313 RepID=UPI00177C9F03|nr:amino acid ABC transporter permease [Rhizobium sp. ARZ01]MBD9375701.1 amino acid ABC transporter permease [Rhizobium sp. ARZ01]